MIMHLPKRTKKEDLSFLCLGIDFETERERAMCSQVNGGTTWISDEVLDEKIALFPLLLSSPKGYSSSSCTEENIYPSYMYRPLLFSFMACLQPVFFLPKKCYALFFLHLCLSNERRGQTEVTRREENERLQQNRQTSSTLRGTNEGRQNDDQPSMRYKSFPFMSIQCDILKRRWWTHHRSELLHCHNHW